jgi:DNA-binding GntR family transcriptional regulator
VAFFLGQEVETTFVFDQPSGLVTAKRASKTRSPAHRRLKRQALVKEVYNLIHADIMSLRNRAANRIGVDKLARDLGISHTPIREALSMLEGAGLVVRKTPSGYYTPPILNRRELDELFEMRLLIEPAAAGYAAERMGEGELAKVAKHAISMDAPMRGADYHRFAVQDSELHRLIAAGSGNASMTEALSRLHVHMHIFRLSIHTETTADAVDEHSVVIQALIRRDAQAADAAMRAHICRSYNRLAQLAKS